MRQSVIATPCHGWPLWDGTTTHELKVGDRVQAAAVSTVDVSSIEYKRAWIHGMVFGDGTKHGGKHKTTYGIRLHGEKDGQHLWRFEEARLSMV
jgi:hypothetical protein